MHRLHNTTWLLGGGCGGSAARQGRSVVTCDSSAANGQVEFTAWERADGNVQNRKAYSLAAANAA